MTPEAETEAFVAMEMARMARAVARADAISNFFHKLTNYGLALVILAALGELFQGHWLPAIGVFVLGAIGVKLATLLLDLVVQTVVNGPALARAKRLQRMMTEANKDGTARSTQPNTYGPSPTHVAKPDIVDLDVRASMPIELLGAATTPGEATVKAPTGQRAQSLLWLGGRSFVVAFEPAARGATVDGVHLPAQRITLLTFQDVENRLPRSAIYEIGWVDDDGQERHIRFEGPGRAVWPSEVDSDLCADRFLNASGLLDHMPSETESPRWFVANGSAKV